MAEEYEIVECPIGDERQMLVLARRDKETFISELASNGKTRGKAASITKSVKRLLEYGQEWGFASEVLKGPLSGTHGDILIYEVRCGGRTTVRVMTYRHDDPEHTLIFLFEFEAHKASKSVGGISSSDLEKGERLAAIARRLMMQRN